MNVSLFFLWLVLVISGAFVIASIFQSLSAVVIVSGIWGIFIAPFLVIATD